MDWSEFHFLRPYWFLALIPLVYLIWRWSRKALSQTGWKGIIDEELLPYVLTERTKGHEDLNAKETSLSYRYAKLALLIAGMLAITALAGPVFERLPQPVFRSDTALVIALDLSRSMDAEDLKPSRLARARFKIADLLKQRKEGQTALIVYAGETFVVTPLTDDTATILSQIKALTTDLMPAQGSRTERALKKASELLLQAGAKQGDVLLITDGISNSISKNTGEVLQAATNLSSKGYRLLILGMGTKQGAPIKLPDGDYLTDRAGNIVIPSLKENELKRLTRSVGGIYQRYTQSDKDISRLSLLLDVKPDENEVLETELSVEQWREDGPWLLLLLVPIAALAFRKGVLLIVILSFAGTSIISDVEAGDLWHRSDQLGAKALEKGDPATAVAEFEDQRWKASAQYQAGDYEAALQSWSALEQSESNNRVEDLYNKGNAQVKMGDYPAALESYKQALQKEPDFEDAQYNYDLVKEALKKQQENQENGQGKDEENEEKGEKDQGEEGKQSAGSSGKDKQEKSESDEQPGSQRENSQDKQEQQASDNSSEQQTDKETDTQSDPENEKAQKDEQGSESQQANMSEQEDENSQPDIQSQQAETLSDEKQQALEQWLRRIPDDPGGLLRRKFIYQYKRQHQAEQETDNAQAW